MDRLVRLMVLKARSGWGYETLVREVADSLHLRRFCRIALTERVPDESTVRKLVKRLGAEVVEEIIMAVLARATGPQDDPSGRRFVARAVRIDSTVVESDIRYPTDLGLAQDAARMLAAEAEKAAGVAGDAAPRVADRSRSIAGRLRKLNRSIAGRTGQSKELALKLTGQAGQIAARSVREARRLAAVLRKRARGRGAQAKLRAADRIEQIAERAEKVCQQIGKRVVGQKITDRLVSISDPDARPIRKGKLRQPTEFGTVMQFTELCENTRRGARGLILPASSQIGSPNESNLLPITGQRLDRLGIRPREIALDAALTQARSANTCRHPTACSSSASNPPAPRKPIADWLASASPAKAASATSNAATASAAAGSKDTTAPAQPQPGRSSPTTSTPSPSAAPDKLPAGTSPPESTTPNGRVSARARPFLVSQPRSFIRGN
jgi:IS5 family transposase